jgi:enoyl-CoA hydratase
MNMTSTESERPVAVEQRGAVLLITIDRPHRRNALDASSARSIDAAIDRLEADPQLRVGVLSGAGGTFCSGMDLKAYLDDETPEIPGRGFGGLTERSLTKPLIAAVEGFALAGGMELALACDLVVASRTAVFGVPEVQRGLVAGGGGVVRLARYVPHVIAMELVLTGNHMSAERAYQVGLVNACVEQGHALDEALVLAERIVANSPAAVQATKAIVQAVESMPLDQAWAAQRPLLEQSMQTEDAVEGARAFAEKREPRWTGR